MSALVEKLHLPKRNPEFHEAHASYHIIPVLLIVFLLGYYCMHPGMYSAEGDTSLLRSNRTYITMIFSLLLISLWMAPNELSDRVNRILSWIWFAAAPFAVYFSLLYLNADKYSIDFFKLDKIALALTFVFLFLLQGILFGVTGSLRISVVIYAVAIAALGIANCFVISFRGTALSGADVFSVTTASTVMSEYTYTLDWYMFMEIMLTFAICTVSLKLKRVRLLPLAVRGVFLALVAVGAGGFYYLCGKTDFLEEHDIRSIGFTHQLRYKQYDMLFTTLTTCFYLVVDKPEGYSLQAVQEIGEKYVNSADEAATATGTGNGNGNSVSGASGDGAEAALPNVVVIMNESLADYTDIGRTLALSEDYMPFIHSLTENTIKGTAYASVFGANTPNSEYEFLTGNTMAFLPVSSVGFNLFVRGDMPSLASELGSLGYYTLAMHPYRGTNYRRNVVYPQIGFDTYYTRDDFSDYTRIRNYISDGTLFERIIEEYEKSVDAGQQILSYNVTIQNHGGYYSSNTKNLALDIEVLNEGIDKTKAKIYVNLVKETDRVFQELLEYFETRQEPVVVIMFGDHQPSIGDSTYQYLLGGTEDQLTGEELMEKYKIPFICWANYDIEEEVIEATSLNYLWSILADRLELPLTGYQRYLLDLSEEIPVINVLGYWGADGSFYELDDKTSPYYERINEYNILEYNYIFGGDNRYLELFTLDTDTATEEAAAE